MLFISRILSLVFAIATVAASNPSFRFLDSTRAGGKIPVELYETEKTHLKIAIARTDGPIVNGYFILATEAHDDNGLPHVLEHLIFQGSENYPQNGALDLIGNRLYSGGTHGFTVFDRTGYTAANAGEDGFLALLPIYLDHILYPTLTQNAFNTEVYHINGNGKDGGVVYSEILGVDSLHERSHFQLLKSTYPGSGYSAYVGGALENLRENTTIELAREFHKEFYRPKNLLIIVFGDVSINDIAKSIEKFENKVLSKPNKSPFRRPWQKPLSPLESTTVDVLYPSPDEGTASVYISWRGPNCVTEYRKLVACGVLLDYLCSGSAGPVAREFVMNDEYANSVVGHIEKKSASMLYFLFKGVPTEKIDSIFPKLQNIFQNIADGIEEIDLRFIKNSVIKKAVAYYSELETKPQDTISVQLATYFLYGNSTDDEHLKYLSTVDETYWINIVQKYFINKDYAEVRGILSAEELDRAAKEESDRMQERMEMLGPDGLKQMGHELAKSIKANSLPVPDYVVNSVPYLSPSNLHYHYLKTYRTGDTEFPPGLNLNQWSTYAEAYDLKSNFVYITASLFTHNIDPYLRSYLNTFLGLLFTSPVEKGDLSISSIYEVAERSAKPISLTARLGLLQYGSKTKSGSFTQTATVRVQVEKSMYKIGVNMLKYALRYSIFTVDNIAQVAQQIISGAPAMLGNLQATTLNLLQSILYDPDSNLRLNSALNQKTFLTSVLSKLEDPNTAQEVVDDLNNLRNLLLSHKNFGIHIAANWRALKRLKIHVNTSWKGTRRSNKLRVVPDWKMVLNPASVKSQGEIVGLETTNSAFLNHAFPGVKDINDDDLAALLVVIKYLAQKKGPLFREVRETGSVYSVKMFVGKNDGLVHFTLFRASDILRAYNATVNIITQLTGPHAVWDKTLLDCARPAAIYDIVSVERNIGNVPLLAITSSFEKKSADYTHNLVQKIAAVTEDDVKRIAKLYLAKFNSVTESKTAIVCPLDLVDKIANGMKNMFGIDLAVRESFEDSSLNNV